ncbi:MAG: hypothetical protein CR991_08755 [Proteobacteria bacterium]|nr:MAG: hypothetical protein CR991_08755 [Pseudomonadota bacterium]
MKLGFIGFSALLNLWFLWVSFASAADTPIPMYYYEASLSSGSNSLQRVDLPDTVIAKLMQENYQDLQVWNADEQAVPSRVQSVDSVVNEVQQRHVLSFFRGNEPEELGTLLRLSADGANVTASRLQQAGQQYLIVQRDPKLADGLPMSALVFDWQAHLQQWLPQSIQVESSQNLLDWQTVEVNSLPYVLQENGMTLKNPVLKFARPVNARFIRLSSAHELAVLLPQLQQVSGIFKHKVQEKTLHWTRLSLRLAEDAQHWELDLPPALPVQQWRFVMPQTGDFYQGQWFTRLDSYQPGREPRWPLQSHFQQYRLVTASGEKQSSPEIVPSSSHSKHWRFKFDNPSINVPEIEVAWPALELRFIAQGKAPYKLVFGSDDVVESTAVLGADLARMEAETVNIKAIRQVQDIPEKRKTWPLVWGLWLVLGMGVLLLLWMAYRLWSEMDQSNKPAE